MNQVQGIEIAARDEALTALLDRVERLAMAAGVKLGSALKQEAPVIPAPPEPPKRPMRDAVVNKLLAIAKETSAASPDSTVWYVSDTAGNRDTTHSLM